MAVQIFLNKNLSEEDLNDLFSRVHGTGTGCIEYSEYTVGAMDKECLLTGEMLKNIFAVISSYLSGNKAVKYTALSQLTGEFFASINGAIDYNEFVRAIKE